MPDGDVGSATTNTAESSADDTNGVTRPDLPPTEPPANGDVVPGDPILNAPGGVPASPAPPRKPRAPRRRGRVIGAVGDSAAAADVPSAVAEGGTAHPSGAAGTARRPSMSTRLGTVPDGPPPDAPVAANVRPATPEPADAAGRAERADPTDPVLLVPEVLPPTAPAPRVVPAMPEIVPAAPEVAAPPLAPPAPEPEPAPYDLAEDDPALAFEPPPTRVRRRRPRVRRVTRVIRTVDTWSVFKVASLFAAVLYVSGLLSGVLLWNVAYATGTIDNAERFMESFGWQTFEFKGGEIFHNAWIIGLFAAAGLVGLIVLAAATFNLVSDLVGGVRVTVLEEEMVVRPVSRRRKQRVRKAPPRAATTAPVAEPPTQPGTQLAPRPSNLPTR